MNNITFYFRSSITSKEFAIDTLHKIYEMATEKYVACCKEYRTFHMSSYRQMNRLTGNYIKHNGKKVSNVKGKNDFITRIDLTLAKIIYVVIHSFFKYLVCHVKGGTVFCEDDYDWFFKDSLKIFTQRFVEQKNEFSSLCKIL